MKPNYTSEELVHSPAAIQDRASLVAALADQLHPSALIVLTSSVNATTASSGATSLCEEASRLLTEVVAELSHEEVEFESRKLAEDLAASLERHVETTTDPAWLVSRAQDLSVDLASFWAGLGDSAEARAIACRHLLDSAATRRALATLSHRYYITAEQAADLVAHVHELSLATHRQPVPAG